MYQIPIAHKKCATCRWWSGRRKLVFVGANPQFIPYLTATLRLR